MNTSFGLEHSLSFINCQLKPTDKSAWSHPTSTPRRAVTVSRQSGCGAHVVGEKLVQYLQAHATGDEPPWRLLDRSLVKKVLQDHELPESMARFMPEDRVHDIDDIMEDCFGLHPPLELLIQQISDTVLREAKEGNVVIVGRGANVITAKLPHMLHVRLIGSLERRVENMQRFEGISHKQALERIHREDHGRERYLKRYFGRNIDDSELYHLVINTDRVSFDDAAHIIGDLVLRHALVTAA